MRVEEKQNSCKKSIFNKHISMNQRVKTARIIGKFNISLHYFP